jgi:uncharacterized protein YjbI with pentapeptide repeats
MKPTTPAVRLCALATLLVCLLASLVDRVAAAAVRHERAAVVNAACSQRAPVPPGLDYSGKRLEFVNFAGRDLRNASFRGATLVGVAFIHARLQGADFSNATMMPGGSPLVAATDFTAANLDNACFIGASFRGHTYFTAANLSGADFSNLDLTTSGAIFGDQRLRIDDPQRRPVFRGATMNCEFLAQWGRLDLDSADISACKGQNQLAGLDLSGARMSNVDFTNTVLDGASFAEADLTGAVLRDVSAKKADFSGATLSGAALDRANLQDVRMTGTDLSPCPPPANCTAATLTGAYLKNADLSGSKLESADFTNASLYSSLPVGTDNCDTSKGNCASARNATMTRTVFANAYLAGADFGGVKGFGVNFQGAVLTGANFGGSSFSIEPNAVASNFQNTFLQGASFDGALLGNVSMAGAFVDFRPGGNILYIKLGPLHTRFPGWKTPGQPVCTRVTYGAWSTLPTRNPTLVCPDGQTHGARDCASTGTQPCGCGALAATAPLNPFWNNGLDIALNDPPGSYQSEPTYGSKADPLCARNLAW